MFVCGLSLVLGFAFLLFFFRGFYYQQNQDKKHLRFLAAEEKQLSQRAKDIESEVKEKEEKIYDIWNVYQINKQLLGAWEIEKLCDLFLDNLRRLIYIKDVVCLDYETKKEGYISYKYQRCDKTSYIYIKCDTGKEKQVSYILSQYQLIFQRARMYRRLQQLSLTDELTGLANRRYFMRRFEEEFERAERFGLNLSFLMVDIDDFKSFNDNYGHLVGDSILKKLSHILLSNLREIDLLGRFGGEEFAAILPETEKKHALAIGQRLVKKVADEDFLVYDERLKVTISLGIASFPQDVKNKDLLLEMADKALYKAKRSGKNRIAFF